MKEISWIKNMHVPAFDSVVARYSKRSTSFTEEEALKSTFWDQGEDARLREDYRFRQTPAGRWMVSQNLLANDELRKLFTKKLRASLPLVEALEELGDLGERCWVFCSADKRFVLDGDNLRLSEQELSDSLLVEDALDIEKYISHLPIRNLEAVAASEPIGEWGPTAQEDMGDILGWVRINIPGIALNDRMFVARIKGHSMDDGRQGIIDGSYSLFELWPAGTRQGKIVLVRGSFHDPETGGYAVKKYVADARDEEGRHHYIALTSLNPDKERYPDIVLDPGDDHAVVVIAEHLASLSGYQYGREPKPAKVKKTGRRNVNLDYVKGRLQKRFDQIFSDKKTVTDRDEEVRKQSRLVCLDFEAGGLHFETDPLSWLPKFVKRVNIQIGGTDESVVLGSNLKNLTWRQIVPPSKDRYSLTAPEFEEEIGGELMRLTLDGLAPDSVSVFKVDASGIGRQLEGKTLSPGQEYRIIIPPELRITEVVDIGEWHSFTNGWQLWDLEMPSEIGLDLQEMLNIFELKTGPITPLLSLTGVGPVNYQQTPKGDTFPCFHLHQPPIIKIVSDVQLPGELSLFVISGDQFISYTLPVGDEHFLRLEELPVGPAIIQLLHKRTKIAPVTQPLFIVDTYAPPVQAEIILEIAEAQCSVGKINHATLDVNLESVQEEELRMTGPPLWPVRSFWQDNTVREVDGTYLSQNGDADFERLLDKTQEKRKSYLPGDLVFDCAELGRVELRHGGNPDPEELLDKLVKLLEERGEALEGLGGQYEILRKVWLDPVLTLMGLEHEDLPTADLQMASAGATGLLLYRTVRKHDGSIVKEKHSVLVLVANKDELLKKGKGSSWEYADYLCEKHALAMAIISDGVHWMRHRRASKMKGNVFSLKEIAGSEKGVDFEPFLSDCGGW